MPGPTTDEDLTGYITPGRTRPLSEREKARAQAVKSAVDISASEREAYTPDWEQRGAEDQADWERQAGKQPEQKPLPPMEVHGEKRSPPPLRSNGSDEGEAIDEAIEAFKAELESDWMSRLQEEAFKAELQEDAEALPQIPTDDEEEGIDDPDGLRGEEIAGDARGYAAENIYQDVPEGDVDRAHDLDWDKTSEDDRWPGYQGTKYDLVAGTDNETGDERWFLHDPETGEPINVTGLIHMPRE